MKLRPVVLACVVCLWTAAAVAAPAAAPTTVPDFPDRLLVWELPESLDAAGPTEVTVEVVHHGRVTARHAAQVVLDPAPARHALEILPAAPAERAAFAAMAEAGADVRIRVLLDGKVVDEAPLADLRIDRQALPADLRLLPQRHAAPSAGDAGLEALFAAGLDCSERDACEDNCADNYALCLSYYCGGVAWCEACENGYISCMDGCPECVCTDPKSVSTYTTHTYIRTSWVQSQCYDGYTYDNSGTMWDELRHTLRVDEYERTTMCDGSTSDRLLRSWYEYPTCWQEQYWKCTFNVWGGYPWPQC